MWEAAKGLDNPRQQGRVAKVFGLVDPHDGNRPTFTEYIFKSLEPSKHRIEASSTPAPAPPPPTYVESIPTTTPPESAAKSGHAYLNEIHESRPKSKKKTKGIATLDNPNEEPEPDDIELEGLESFPVALPTYFKLGKRLLKVQKL
jgi:hypothetical protein